MLKPHNLEVSLSNLSNASKLGFYFFTLIILNKKKKTKISLGG